jgi:glycine cleavage system regulatory protein
MQISLVMTIIGRDRPGLVDSVASRVTEHGGNWLESRMSRLGGHFAGILRVEVASEQEASLVGSLKGLASQGLTIVAHSERPEAAGPEKKLSLLEIVGQDRPGIVRQISHVLARHGVNVEELETQRGSAAMSGEMLFKARAKVHLPEGCNLAGLRKELEKIAEDLIVDVSLQELPAGREINQA